MSARILIIDDEEIILKSCLRIFTDKDYHVDTAPNGMAALRKIEEGQYDLLILDLMMPKMNGLEVLRKVKESHPDIRVIMVTGLAQDDSAEQALALGAFSYLPKPFDPEELKQHVRRALAEPRPFRELKQATGRLP
ncbi:MAG: response regulator [Sterolibacterium sp.]|nr:response regulator [Sterolibacterium sp.]